MNLLVITSAPPVPFFAQITATGTVGTTGTILARFSKPIRCSSVSTTDFTVRLQNVHTLNVTGVSCTSDSNKYVTITTGSPLVKGTSISVSMGSGSVFDPGGGNLVGTTRTTTVA